jgi:hypothetical protein
MECAVRGGSVGGWKRFYAVGVFSGSGERMRASLRRRERDLWLWWVLATALGELLGFAVPAILGAVASWAMAGLSGVSVDFAFAGVMVVAGVGEGSVLGFAQWLVLRRYIRKMTRREWVLATGIAAGVAWIIGMLPSTFGDIIAVDSVVLVGGAVVLGTVLVASIGFAQWVVLRRHIRNVGWWVPANALAWVVGVAVPFGGLALVPEGSPMTVWAVVGVVSGLLMGAVVGAITGLALVRLLRASLGAQEDVA